MPTYHIQGSLTYSVTVEVVADTLEEAIELAERDDWTRVVEEGRWKDAGNFQAHDGEDSVSLVDDDEQDED